MSEPYPKSQQLARGERRYRRKVASPKQWQAIIAAKGGSCRVCGDREHVQLHHVVPRDLHGDDVPTNIVGLCPTCHEVVTLRKQGTCLALIGALTDAEYAYAVDKLGEAVWERVYGITYTR